MRALLLTLPLARCPATAAGLWLLLGACVPLAPGDERFSDESVWDAGQSGHLDAAAGESDAQALDGSFATPVDAGDDAGAREPHPERACPAQRGLRLVAQIPGDMHWTCDYDYELEGAIVLSGGTLSIDPGVRVRARPGAILIIARDARIEANGTAEQPIVFGPAAHPAAPAHWRGLVLLGGAPSALPANAALWLPDGDERGFFGGTNDRHSCGTLRYTRVEFAGGLASVADMPNAGITLAGCGSDTHVEYLQVHGSTDGIGLIGGSAPLKRVIVSAATADGIEWSAGYTGFIQFAIVQSFLGAGAAIKGSRREFDQTTLPASSPIILNATLVGASDQGLPLAPNAATASETGLVLQAGTRARIDNSVFYGFAGAWVDVIGTGAASLMQTGEARVAHSIFGGPEPRALSGFPGAGVEQGDTVDDDGFSEDSAQRAPSLVNSFPGPAFTLRGPFARPGERPDFSATGFISSSSLVLGPAEGWHDRWEFAPYAGALPKVTFDADRKLDWTWNGSLAGAGPWTQFPRD